MKKVIALFCLMAIGTTFAETNEWAANISVTQIVAKVKIENLQVGVLPDNKIVVIVRWSWLSSTGKVIRNDLTRYTEEEISAKLAARGSSIEQLRQLFLSIAAEEASK